MPIDPTQNFLSPRGYRFVLKRAPHVTYMSQEVPLPGIELNGVESPVPFQRFNRPSSKLQFSPLVINFAVDENMENFKEIFNWMTSIAPSDLSKHQELVAGNGIVSDGTLVILSSNHNPLHEVEFRNLWPTSLSELQFNSTAGDIMPVKATVTFEYTEYAFKS